MTTLFITLGDQLYSPEHLPEGVDVYMAEDHGLCTNVRHHQQKLVFFLAAMRSYADELNTAGHDVTYRTLDDKDKTPYADDLLEYLRNSDYTALQSFEVEDRAARQMLDSVADDAGLDIEYLESPGFTCSRQTFADYADEKKRLHMADFYKQQRRDLFILMDGDDPRGGKWSFDEDNRKKLPKDVEPPTIRSAQHTTHVKDVIELVSDRFSDHPGSTDDFWWPTTRKQAERWLNDFIDQRLADFGPYEDAMTTRSATVFHSALSPLINCGLLRASEVVDAVVEASDDAPLQSVEGFVRQVIGWREFIRGVYHTHGEEQEKKNFFDHQRKLTDAWYSGETGIPPLDDAIHTAERLAWTHHIPRLMVLGNMMTLCEIEPTAVHTWFMEMYIDSADWVMGPNVYGMGIFSDGGLFATKPYVCGSNYWLKMSDYPKGDWCDTVDGLYWRFIDKHREFFSGNPRLALIASSLDRMKDERKDKIFTLANEFIEEMTG